jgi:hypothetical protein
MAHLPIIAGVQRVAFHWTTAGGASAINVMYFRATTEATCFTALDANATSGMWTLVSNGYSVTQLIITPLDGSSATVTHPTTGAKWTGGTAGDYIPNLALIVKETTGKRGKSYRGRIYLPAITEASQINGVLTPATVTTMQTAWNTFYTAMSTATVIPCVVSQKLGTAENVTTFTVEPMAATQRMRLSRLR